MKPAVFSVQLTNYLMRHLASQRNLSPNTIRAYRDGFSLFLRFCRDQHGIALERLPLKDIDVQLVEEFLSAFSTNGGVDLHVEVLHGTNTHHMVESVFKGFGRALRDAVSPDPRREGVPSTKGAL